MPAEQRRGRKIAMDKAELDAFLAGERTCRLATSSPQGPHLTALWFAWARVPEVVGSCRVAGTSLASTPVFLYIEVKCIQAMGWLIPR